MKKVMLGMFFAFILSSTYGQYIYFNITRKEAGILLKSLNNSMDDTSRISILLQMAEYNVWKPGEDKINLDSAAMFLSQIRTLNAKLRNAKYDGIALLLESSVSRKRGYADSIKQSINKCIKLLQGKGNEFYLTMAHRELLYYYNFKDSLQIPRFKNVTDTLFATVLKIPNPEHKAKASNAIRNFYQAEMWLGGHAIKLYFLNHLSQMAEVFNDKEAELWARKEKADVYLQQGKTRKAERELLELVDQYTAYNIGKCYLTDLLAGVYQKIPDYKNALFYAQETLKNIRNASDSANLPSFYQRIVIIYSQSGDPEQSIFWSKTQLDYLIKTNRTQRIYYSVMSLTSTLINVGRAREALAFVLDKRNKFKPANFSEKRYLALCLARIYETLGQNELAEKYYLESVYNNEMAAKTGEQWFESISHQYLASFYLENRQLEKAKHYFDITIKNWTSGNESALWLYERQFNFRLDTIKGNYRSAVKNLIDYQLVYDSIFNATKSKQIQELRVSYENDEKDQLINLKEQNIQLLTKQGELQVSKLKQAAVLRNIIFGAILLLIVIISLLYSRYRLKQRTNRKLELKQQEIELKNITLQHLVNEKSWLVKEIHHRVKNNFQTVMALLGTQSGYLKNEGAIKAIVDSQHRIQAMSLIHQKLYQTDNLSAINLQDYISELVDYLKDSYNVTGRIRFKQQVGQIELGLAHCIPLGLILNEGITNAIKYAFPNNGEGVITIRFHFTSPHHLELSIMDNGIGSASSLDGHSSNSMGMNLMKGLSEQIGAHFHIAVDNGTEIVISFPYEPKDESEISQSNSYHITAK